MSTTEPSVFSQTAAATNEFLEKQFALRIKEAAAMHSSYASLWTETARVVTHGGKRLRPYLVMIGCGRYTASAIPIAAAQELLHAAMLIHDDIIDRDNVRRGEPNINGAYFTRYTSYLSPESAQHYAHGAAILAGDLLLSEAYRYISEFTVTSDASAKLVKTMHTSIFTVVGGELMDVEASFMHDLSFDPIMISRYKTSSYSCVGPLLSGAYWAGASPELLEKLTEFGTYTGIAFQLQDDLLNVFGDENKTGKPTLADLREGKATYLIQQYISTLDDAALANFRRIFGNQYASNEELEMLKIAIAESDAVAKTESLIHEYFEKATAITSTMPDAFRREELAHLLRQLDHRTA